MKLLFTLLLFYLLEKKSQITLSNSQFMFMKPTINSKDV